ncbi:MAG: serine protease [Elusimicrobiota bacterium]
MLRILALALLAAVPASAGFQKASIYLPENLPAKPTGFERAYGATIGLSIPNDGRICTGTPVSSDGYLLTNLHCVLHCLEDKGWFKDGRATLEQGENYKIVRIAATARKPKDTVCENLVWDEGDVYAANGRVVLLGSAKANFSEEKVGELPETVVEAVYANMHDFALLKYELPAPAACIPAAPASPSAGAEVWGIGYPSFTMRYDGFDSSGYKKHIAYGRVRGAIREDPYLQGLVAGDIPWRRLDRVYSQPDLLMSDLDTMGGNSGGPLLDSSGRLVGLTWGIVASSSEKHLKATALGLRVEALRRDIGAALGEARVKQVFACPQEAAAAAPARAAFSVPSVLNGAGPLPHRIDFDGGRRP